MPTKKPISHLHTAAAGFYLYQVTEVTWPPLETQGTKSALVLNSISRGWRERQQAALKPAVCQPDVGQGPTEAALTCVTNIKKRDDTESKVLIKKNTTKSRLKARQCSIVVVSLPQSLTVTPMRTPMLAAYQSSDFWTALYPVWDASKSQWTESSCAFNAGLHLAFSERVTLFAGNKSSTSGAGKHS